MLKFHIVSPFLIGKKLFFFGIGHLHPGHGRSWDLSFARIFSTSPPGSTTMASLDSESPDRQMGLGVRNGKMAAVWMGKLWKVWCLTFFWARYDEISRLFCFFSDGNRKPWNKQPDMLSFLGVVIIVNHPRSLCMGLSSMVDFHGQVSIKWWDGSYSGEKPQ